MNAESSYDFIWVTAPSGAGKTVVATELAQLVGGEILTDAHEMLALNQSDEDHRYHSHPYDDEQFILTSTHHFDQAVTRISDKLQGLTRDNPTVVELARGVGDNSNVDASYQRLLGLIPESVFARSVFLYVKTMHQQRMARNASRRTNDFSVNLRASSFRVPIQAMEGFYRNDDFEAVRSDFPCPTYVLDNSKILIASLRTGVQNIAREMGVCK